MSIKVAAKPISEILDKKSSNILCKYPAETIWNKDGISLAKRVKGSRALKRKVDTALRPENLKKYVIKANLTAPTRCIDGRITLGWENFSKEQKAVLGPKIAGGTAHAALAHRIVDTNTLHEDLLFEHDIEYVVKRYKKIGIGFGGHADTHQRGWNTGCGAVDNIAKILEHLRQPEPQEQLRALTALIIGKSYDDYSTVNEVFGRILLLDGLKATYLPKHKKNSEYLYKKAVVDLIRQQSESKHEPVPQLAGDHKEIAVVLNYKDGTTFDTDRFGFDNDNELQVFGWDIWEIYEEAERLYPYDIHDSLGKQQEAVSKRIKHITTRTLLGIATAMVLTDGSLKLVTIGI